MLTQGEDVEAHALRQRGWSISAIARHLNRDRKTVHAYLDGQRQPGRRATSTPDPLERFEAYLATAPALQTGNFHDPSQARLERYQPSVLGHRPCACRRILERRLYGCLAAV